MNWVYALKFFYLVEDDIDVILNGKDITVCGHGNSDVDNGHCASENIATMEMRSVYSALRYGSIVSWTVFLQLVFLPQSWTMYDGLSGFFF